MTDIRTSQADVGLVTESSVDIQMSQADVLAMFRFPAEFLEVSQADVQYVSAAVPNIQVSQADVIVLVKGRVDDPSVRAWTYTLDGHDYYVLRLGNSESLVYDLTSQQWSVYVSQQEPYWSVYTGANWVGGNRYASSFGSNIVVGSDANGALFTLDPDKPNDDSPVANREPSSFVRRVTGQVVLRGYDYQRVFEVQLLGSLNELENNADTDVELLYSDNRGDSYISAGTVSTVDLDYTIRGSWRSLGSFTSPGRLFRVEDFGALKRIDSLTVNLGNTQ